MHINHSEQRLRYNMPPDRTEKRPKRPHTNHTTPLRGQYLLRICLRYGEKLNALQDIPVMSSNDGIDPSLTLLSTPPTRENEPPADPVFPIVEPKEINGEVKVNRDVLNQYVSYTTDLLTSNQFIPGGSVFCTAKDWLSGVSLNISFHKTKH